MENEVKVSVIATGFDHDHTPERTAPVQEEKGEEYISLNQWSEMTRSKLNRSREQIYKPESGEMDELGIPAVLRYQQVGGSEHGA